MDLFADMVEARALAGPGPWRGSAAAIQETSRLLGMGEALTMGVSEAQLPGAVGAFGDIELALQNVDWRREINFSWLEFSRWGIQNIILISRLYYLKNPIVRRLVDVCAAYVFARGVEVTTEDEAANEVLEDFFETNRNVLGHVGLMRLERAKDTDGNLFFCLFPDAAATGAVKVRMIEPIEIADIRCDPQDADTEWFYQRVWVETLISAQSTTATQERRAWYPALGLQRAGQPDSIAGEPIMWDSPIYHRKSGSVGKWRYGCPRIYPMLDWAKESRKYLESCASLRQSLAQIALKITTKGGQQALQGLKQQFQTTVGPAANIWDQNPPTNAAVFGSGPGTEIEAFKTQGSGLDPEGVRQYKLMCCMVKGVPETFIGDVSTGNLATATSLDRPTETVMLELQEEWAEDLAVLCGYALAVSDRATGGKLRAALAKQGVDAGAVEIREAARRYKPNGLWVHEYPKKSKKAEIKIRVNFPAIREGDVPQLTAAIVQAMTLGNKGGQVTGIDEREGCRQLFRVLGIEDGDALIEEMYPEKEYDPDRTTEELPPPVPKAQPSPAGATPGAPEGPTQPGEQGDAAPPAQQPKEAMRAAARRLTKALQLLEAESHAND